jgi:signal recognition particle GTPase
MGQINPVDIAKAAVEHAKNTATTWSFFGYRRPLHVDEALMEEPEGYQGCGRPH